MSASLPGFVFRGPRDPVNFSADESSEFVENHMKMPDAKIFHIDVLYLFSESCVVVFNEK
eukprot:scaffold10660_cov176-Amphora_coffeaeformis.AAC.10